MHCERIADEIPVVATAGATSAGGLGACSQSVGKEAPPVAPRRATMTSISTARRQWLTRCQKIMFGPVHPARYGHCIADKLEVPFSPSNALSVVTLLSSAVRCPAEADTAHWCRGASTIAPQLPGAPPSTVAAAAATAVSFTPRFASAALNAASASEAPPGVQMGIWLKRESTAAAK